MVLRYSEILMDHFRNPRNVGKMENPDAKATEGSPACGDMVTLYLKVNPETLVIEDIKFESYGCASNIATGSIITEMAKGKTLEEAKKITWKEAAEALGGLPPVKTHCSVLAVDVLKAAIEAYEEEHGLIPPEKRVPTDEKIVRNRLRHIMNPLTGVDIVRMNLVKEIEVADGRVRIVLDLEKDHPFAQNIEEEIHERIDRLWDVKEVVVEFAG